MSVSLRGSSLGALSSGSVSLPVTTNAGDCVLVMLSVAGVDANTATMSGAGATWLSRITPNLAPSAEVYVGYGCSAGNTSITISGSFLQASNESMVISVFSGLVSTSSPLDASYVSPSLLSGGSYTSGNLTVTSGDLLIATLADYSPTSWGTGAQMSWTNSGVATVIQSNGITSQRDIWTGYAISSVTGTDTFSFSFVSSNTLSYSLVSLKASASSPTANSGFLSFMGG